MQILNDFEVFGTLLNNFLGPSSYILVYFGHLGLFRSSWSIVTCTGYVPTFKSPCTLHQLSNHNVVVPHVVTLCAELVHDGDGIIDVVGRRTSGGWMDGLEFEEHGL